MQGFTFVLNFYPNIKCLSIGSPSRNLKVVVVLYISGGHLLAQTCGESIHLSLHGRESTSSLPSMHLLCCPSLHGLLVPFLLVSHDCFQ